MDSNTGNSPWSRQFPSTLKIIDGPQYMYFIICILLGVLFPQIIGAEWRHKLMQVSINIGPGSGLVDGSTPLPKQRLLIISEVLWHSPEGNCIGNTQDTYPWYEFENYLFKIMGTSPTGQWVQLLYGTIIMIWYNKTWYCIHYRTSLTKIELGHT